MPASTMMTTCRSDLFSRVREAVPMQAAAERYGFEPNRAGFINCPFHSEDTASLKIYPGSRGWHCFGCGAGGDVTEFVRRLFRLDPRAALLRLDHDFHLGLIGGPVPGRAEADRMRREAAKRAYELETYRAGYNGHVSEARALRAALRLGPPAADRAGEYAALMGRLDYLDWWFSANPWR
jgi:hypothetical protein